MPRFCCSYIVLNIVLLSCNTDLKKCSGNHHCLSDLENPELECSTISYVLYDFCFVLSLYGINIMIKTVFPFWSFAVILQ